MPGRGALIMTTHSIRWLLAVVLLAPTPLLAQEPGARPQSPGVAYYKAWDCRFTSYVYADWKGILATARTATDEVAFSVDRVNAGEGTARFVGNLGSTPLSLISGEGVITFLEITPARIVNSLTIFDPVVSNGTFKAVYSRHTQPLKDGTPIPSQAWGFCVGIGISR